MSDYMFMLESHLSPEQNQVVGWVEAAATQAGVNAFLAGGAMRDTMGGFPIRDLDFTIEGNALKLVKQLEQKNGAKILENAEERRGAELLFPNGVHAQVASAVQLTYPKPGAKPHAKPASIHEDLRGRDFTINSIAISLNKGSRGLLLDPTNGLSDLERREIRVNSHHTLYDDPSRILRMFRLRARLGFELDARTQSQYENVREAGLESKIGIRELHEELLQMADEPNPLAVLETLDREKLSTLFSPALTGARINAAGFGKLEKARQAVPYGMDFHTSNLGLFLYLLTEKFTPAERSELISRLELAKPEVDAWQKLEGRAKKLENALKSPKLKRPSQVYTLLKAAAGEEVLFLVMFSEHRLVKDRLKNHLQKYLPTAHEVSDRELAHLNLDPASPKFQAAKQTLILAYVDGRVKKPAPPPEPPPPPPGQRGPGRPPGRPPAANAPTVVPKAPTAPPPRVAPPPGSQGFRQPLTRPAGSSPPISFAKPGPSVPLTARMTPPPIILPAPPSPPPFSRAPKPQPAAPPPPPPPVKKAAAAKKEPVKKAAPPAKKKAAPKSK
jgi:tRNA nucleotidyltransferase/poly(A) polymerase